MQKDIRREQQRKDIAAHLASLEAASVRPPEKPKPALDIPHADDYVPPPSPPPFSEPQPASPAYIAQPTTIDVTCPYCTAVLPIPAQMVGGAVTCGGCQGAFQTDLPRVAPQSKLAPQAWQGNSGIANPYSRSRPSGAILPCVIISLVGSGLGIILWLSTLVFFFMAAIPLILGVFEIMFLCNLGNLDRREAHRRARNLAILEIVLGLVSCGNLINIICGAIVLGNSQDD